MIPSKSNGRSWHLGDLLAAVFVLLVGYDANTISKHDWKLLSIFFGDMQAMTWPGLFNFDFMGFLLLSGLWVSWCHQFSVSGLLLGAVVVFGGMMFLSLYLFIASTLAKGDVNELLSGKSHPSA